MAGAILAQDWNTVRGSVAGTIVTMQESDYVDLMPFQDVVAFLEVSEIVASINRRPSPPERHRARRAVSAHSRDSVEEKPVPTCNLSYWEPEIVAAILAEPDRATTFGARDHALLLFLYNTGARVSETIAVRRHDLQLTRPYHVRLHGKGGKDRTPMR